MFRLPEVNLTEILQQNDKQKQNDKQNDKNKIKITTEAADWMFLKLCAPRGRLNPEKIPLKGFAFIKVASFRPLYRHFFKGFAKIKN